MMLIIDLREIGEDVFVNYEKFLIFIGILAIAVTIAGSIYIAKYTWDNFKEVVSRRMLWRNSNVGLFQKRLEYTLSRFGAAFLVFLTMFLALLLFLMTFL
jgi:hypothetical protein